MKSATALTGLLSASKILNSIVTSDGNIAPCHRLGLKGQIGVRHRTFDPRGTIVPPAERLYALLPAGVETRAPSAVSSSILSILSIFIWNFAA